MATKQKFKSDAFESIHSSASALFGVGAIDKTTLRQFDSIAWQCCLISPDTIQSTQRTERKLRRVIAYCPAAPSTN